MPVQLYCAILGDDFGGRRPVWCPSLKQNVSLLRKLVESQCLSTGETSSARRWNPVGQTSVRLFFNGQELKDDYAIEDYSIEQNNVIQVFLPDSVFDQNEVEKTSEKRIDAIDEDMIEDSDPDGGQEQPTIQHDEYYSVGDYVDACDQEQTGAWFAAQIVSIQDNHTYRVSHQKPSLGLCVKRTLSQIRPQSCRPVPMKQLQPGLLVLACVEKLWYVAAIESIVRSKTAKVTKIHLTVFTNIEGNNQTRLTSKIVRYKANQVLFLESNVRKDQQELYLEQIISKGSSIERFVEPDCFDCVDRPQVNCDSCGCLVCSQKSSPDKQLVCDECDRSTHLWCLRVPLTTIPKQSHWYCDRCRNESQSEIEQLQKKHLQIKHKIDALSKSAKSTRQLYGMTCAGRTKTSPDAKPKNVNDPSTFGPIDNVPVGTWWRFRVQASEAGVHAPLVAGIHGKENLGAYSVVFSAVYPEDIDLGDNLYYTASGGRDMGGKGCPRTGGSLVQDQQLKRANKALAMNCWAPFNSLAGANAADYWRLGKPVRLLRSGNGRNASKSSLYLPKIGVRYDGIYKVVKYWPEKTNTGHLIWRFHLRRDDKAPAPWTDAGRNWARRFELKLEYPTGWGQVLAQKRCWKIDQKMLGKQSQLRKKIKKNDCDTIVKQCKFQLPNDVHKLIRLDSQNSKIWSSLLKSIDNIEEKEFYQKLMESFLCVCCMELVKEPFTTNCGHNFCMECIQNAIKAQVDRCPTCRAESFVNKSNYNVHLNSIYKKKNQQIKPNSILKQILTKLNMYKKM